MTEKRFIQPNKECRVIKNTKTGETAIYYDTEDGLMFLKWLNELHEENTKLKEALKELKEIGDYQEMRMQELDDENEQLKQENKELEKFRYNVFKRIGEIND